jgi:hypothetical protein
MFGKKKTNKTNSTPVQNTKHPAKQPGKVNTRIAKDVIETIPYRSVYPGLGIIEDLDGRFSKSYRLEDTNFVTEDDDKKASMFLNYERMLNSIVPGMIGQLNIFNRSVDMDTIRNQLLMKPNNDGLNHYRDEWNDVFLSKLQEGRNNLKKDKIFTVSVKADNIFTANDALKNIDRDVNKNVRAINGANTSPMTIEDRLGMLYDIYNLDNDLTFDKKVAPVSKNGKIDFALLHKYGMSSKDLIAPDSFDFARSQFRIGESYCAAFYVDHLPTILSTDILEDITNISCNMIVSVTYVPMEQGTAMQYIRRQDTSINAQIESMRDKNHSDYIPAELEDAKVQTRELIKNVLSRDQKIFSVSCVVVLITKSQEELKQYTANLRSTLTSHLCQMRFLTNQEELALNTALPFAEMQISMDRMLTTEAASVFMPFNVRELFDTNGSVYYGLNAISKNMIMYNRKKAANFNGIILGKSGSGKSVFTKQEIAQLMLNSTDRIIIIDPEGEYVPMGKAFGASIVNIDSSNTNHINPLDMDMQYGGSNENPLAMKSDYVLTLIESMLGQGMELSPIAKTIVQRVTRNIFRGYYKIMQPLLKEGITCKLDAMPTLVDFYEELLKQREGEAQMLAAAIEPYCVGTSNLFAFRTNVDRHARMIIYDVSAMNGSVKELAMQVCMNDAWNHIITNGKQGYYTDLYMDEFHLYTKTHTSAQFMQNIYKRARKWRGVPTGITQNIGDLLVNDEAKAMINNCNFIAMFNQSPMDRQSLAQMYQISPALQDYMTDQGIGIGILYTGKTLVPFESVYPHTEDDMFKLMISDVKSKEDLANRNK